MNDASFERSARKAAAWMRTEAERIAEPDAALAHLLADESGTQAPTPSEPAAGAPRRRWLAGLASAAAVIALVVGIVVIGAQRSEAPTLVSPATSTPTTPTSTAVTPSTSSPTTSSTAPTTAVESDPAIDASAGVPFAQLMGLFEGRFEVSGIDRVCENEFRCTQVQVDPSGAPISFDPITGTITRHMSSGESFTLPNVDQSTFLVAGGPDGVVYVLESSDRPESNDLVAYSLAPGDAGRELARVPTSYGIGDGELLPSPNGLLMVPTGAPGLQPADDSNLAHPWVSRTDSASVSSVPVVRADFFGADGIRVEVDGRAWTFTDPTGGASPSLLRFTPTFDGGFVGVLQPAGAGRVGVARGWADGSVETWSMPPMSGRPVEFVPTRSGQLLVPSPGTYVRVDLFDQRDGDYWTEPREFDIDAWTVSYPGLDEFLDDNDPWWETDPIGFANALGGRTDSPAETLEIRALPADEGSAVVQVTTEGFLDDSVFGSRLTVELRDTFDGYRLQQVGRAQTCQPGRGHQDYRAATCV